MNFEIVRAFIDGLLIGILGVILIQKISLGRKIRKFEKMLDNMPDDLPIERENEDE